jgi:small-conductance mechanosensitive channel
MGISAILAYIPNVIAAAIILALGLFVAGFVSRLVRGAAASAGVRMSDVLADVAYWAVTIFAALGAIEQLNIAPTLVQTIYTALVAAIALAAALAFGLGLREQARDVVAGRALLDQLHSGDDISVERVQGRVEKVGPLKTLIRSTEGLVSVPNHMLADQIFRIGGGRLAAAGGGGGGQTSSSQTPPASTPLEGGETGTAPLRPTEHQWRPKPETPPEV